MSAFLFTAWVSQFDMKRELLDSCVNLIVVGQDEPKARAWFESWLLKRNEDSESAATKIEKLIVSPMVEYVLTEAESALIDWPTLCGEAEEALANADASQQQCGYWVDCDATVPPAKLASNLDALRQSLPPEVRSGLNWDADKAVHFLVSALAVAAPQSLQGIVTPDEYESDADRDVQEEPNSTEIQCRAAPFPELADREAVAVVRARNAVVAAWLWRRYAADTRLANNPIRVDAWCGAGSPDD